jgi:5'-nucleotidase
MKRHLYIDLDGVMADFDEYFLSEFGVVSSMLDDATMWKWINKHGYFFRNLPVMDHAVDFFRSVEHLNPFILTACPRTDYEVAAIQKRQWVYEHLSETVTVIPMLGGKHKCLFMHSPGDVLIDDFEKNCIPWRKMGGVAIHHKNFDETKKQMNQLFSLQLP